MANEDYLELQRFFDVALDLLCIADIDGNFLKVNKAWEDILGYSLDELEQKKFLEFVHPDDVEATLAKMSELDEQKAVINFTNRYRCKDGSYRYIEWRSHPHGKQIYAAARDITERKNIEIALRENEARNRALIEAIPDMLFRYNRDGGYLDVQVKNELMLHPMARNIYQEEGLVGKTIKDVLPIDTAEMLLEKVRQAVDSNELQVAEYSYKAGEKMQHYEARLVAIGENEVVSIVRDVTASKQSEAELKYLSMHDPLTGLFNRNYFENELDRLEGSREYPIAIISADLDGLKLVNDTLGHKEGDRFILACAAVLKGALRGSDVLARVGGDEFALVLPKTGKEVGEELLRRIYAQVGQYNEQQPGLPLSISLGLAVSENTTQPLEEVYNAADRDMYKDKLQRSKEARGSIVRSLLSSVYNREKLADGYNESVQELCIKLGQKVGLSDTEMADLVLLAQVYDLGKVTVPEQLLTKKGKLTEQEWEIIRQHSEKGFRIAFASSDLANVADLILRHHENWDGSGYPLGLREEEIPVECRILAIVNSFTAMINKRSYARTLSRPEALRELELCAGKFYDPRLVSLFKSLAE